MNRSKTKSLFLLILSDFVQGYKSKLVYEKGTESGINFSLLEREKDVKVLKEKSFLLWKRFVDIKDDIKDDFNRELSNYIEYIKGYYPNVNDLIQQDSTFNDEYLQFLKKWFNSSSDETIAFLFPEKQELFVVKQKFLAILKGIFHKRE